MFLSVQYNRPESPGEVCVDVASLKRPQNCWASLGGSTEADASAWPLPLLSDAILPPLVILSPPTSVCLSPFSSQSPSYPNHQLDQEPTIPVPLQSHGCSSQALLGTFLTLPSIAPHQWRLLSFPPLSILGPPFAFLFYSSPPPI